MRRIIFAVLLFFSIVAQAAPQVEVHGKVDRFFYGVGARPEGLVLMDHTVLKFSPQSVVDTRLVHPGDTIFARGEELLKKPNRVLFHVIVKKGSEIVTNEVRGRPLIPQPESPEIGPQINYKSTYDTSSLLAVSTRPDGEVNRLILKNGTVVRIPHEGFIPPNRLALGSRIYVQGISASKFGVEPGRPKFIHATDVEGPSQRTLIQVRGPGRWASETVKVKQLLVTPSGEADGALLTNNHAIRFDPLPSYEVADLKSGTELQIAGREIENQVHTGLVYLTEQQKLFQFGKMRRVTQAAGIAVAPQVSPAPRALMPIHENSTVEAVLRLPGGAIDAIVLADGTVVRTSRTNLKEVSPGDRVAVSGFGGHYVEGTAIDADRINRIS